MNKEFWRAIPGFEGLYEASTMGRIRSLDHDAPSKNRWGEFTRKFKGRILTTAPNNMGYPQITLCDGRGGRHQRTVHSVVGATFLGDPPAGQMVLHNDGVKINCRLKNLRHGFPKDNSADAARHGTQVRGESHGAAIFTEMDVKFIRANRGKIFQKDLAAKFGTTRQYIGLVQRGVWWKHVS